MNTSKKPLKLNNSRFPRFNFSRQAVRPGLNISLRVWLVVALMGPLLAALSFTTVQVAHAASITVTTTSDTLDAASGVCTSITIASLPGPDGQISLREAVCATNNTAGADIINLPSGTYTLTRTGINEDNASTGDLDIKDSLTISGASGQAATTIIDGNSTDRVIDDFPSSPITLNFNDITIRNGKLQAGEFFNIAGGVYIDLNATATFTNCIISNNDATPVNGTGGGIYATGTLTLINTTITNNKGSSQGGGVRSANNLTITNSTFDSNTAVNGAGLWHGTASSKTGTISGSTFSNNTASGDGGGIYMDLDGTDTITNSTITTNHADGSSSSGGGGGIYMRTNSGTGVLNLSSATVYNNTITGTGVGAGLVKESGAATFRLRNTIAVGNTKSAAANDLAGSFISQGYNAIGASSPAFSSTTGDQTGITTAQINLGSLTNNGGTTSTHALQAGSVAVDRGDPANPDGLSTDQRGQARVFNGRMDIGAYESAFRSDLTIAKSHTGNFSQGQTGATYKLTVTNSGQAQTFGTITVVDTLPSGLTATAIAGSGWSCTLGTLTCTRSDVLANGSSYPDITVTVDVAGNASASVTNSATVSGGNESNTGNNTSTDPTTVTGNVDLVIAKSHSGNFTQGQTGAQYSIVVTNNGTAASSGTIAVTDSLPAGLTLTSAASGPDWDCTASTSTTVSCTRATSLSGGASTSTITAVVNVATNTAPSITNTATVSGGGDGNTGNNTDSDPTTVNQLPDLTINKSHSGNFSQGQTGATYSITVTNSGSAATDGSSTVMVTDSLPAGLTATAFGGSGWTCASLPTLSCSRSNALAASASYPAITLTVNVSKTAGSSVTNSTSVSYGGSESNTGNNSDTDPTTVNQLPDLTIDKSHSGNFTQGDTNQHYSIVVSNNGSATATGSFSVTDTLPTGLTGVSASGSGWTCNIVAGTMTCTRSDSLSTSASFPAIDLTVNVASNAAALISNTASISFGSAESDTTNNSDSDSTTINQVPDLTIAKTHSGNFSQGQTGAQYSITVTNGGSAATTGTVTVVDTLPSGLTATAISGSGWTCDPLPALSCTRSDALAVSASYPAITLTVSVAKNAGASLTNSATVSGGGESNTSNDTATDPTTVTQLPDLTIDKSHSETFEQGDTGRHYSIVVTNNGSAATSGTVTVTDTLPSGLTATAMSGTGWVCTLGTLTCTRSDALAASASYETITLTVDVANSAGSSVTNSAAVSYTGSESDTANNSDSDPTTIGQLADLTITKTHSGNFAQGDTGKTYTLTVNNIGNVPTNGSTVTVTDTLPAGLTATAINGAGWTCVLATLTCTRTDALNNGASYPAITLTVNVAIGANSGTNTATVSGGGEVNTTNNTVSDPTTIGPPGATDVGVAKTVNNARAGKNAIVIFTITATNFGPNQATGLQVTDLLPAGFTYQSHSTANGTYTPATGLWNIGGLASNTTATLTITVKLNRDGPLTNTATRTAMDQADTNPANDSASATIRPKGEEPQPANMMVQLRVNPDRQFVLDAAGRLTYSLTLKNLGTGTGRSIHVWLPLDSNLELAYTNFSDPRTWVNRIVTDPDEIAKSGFGQAFVEVRFADFSPNDTSTAELVMQAGPSAQPGSVTTRAWVYWDDDTAVGKKEGSNAVHVKLVAPGQGDNRNDTGGAVQFFTVESTGANGKITLKGDFFSPDERVDLWYTGKDGTSTSLGFKIADKDGVITFEFDTSSLVVGQTYVVAGYGLNSAVTGSAVVTLEAGAEGSATHAVKVRPPTKSDLSAYLSKNYRQK